MVTSYCATWNRSGTRAISAEFASIQRDDKKAVLKSNLKCDPERKVTKLYPFAGENVSLSLELSQISLDEFYEELHEGVEYKVNQDGTASIPEDQIEMDEEATNQ